MEAALYSHNRTLSRQTLRKARIARSRRKLDRMTVVRIPDKILYKPEYKKAGHEHPLASDILDIYAHNRASLKRV